MKVGKSDAAVVSQVDQSKGNMDLTRQVLNGHEIEDAKKHFTDTTSFMNGMPHISIPSKMLFPDFVRAIGNRKA
jgi:hypothetical protein